MFGKKSHKIKAFTLYEMLIVLCIASFVVHLALLLLQLIQKQWVLQEQHIEKQRELALFETLLAKDFNALRISIHNEGRHLKGRTELDSVHYHFFEKFIVRNTDTLAVNISYIAFFLEGEQVVSGSIDAIEIKTQQQSIFVYKEMGATYKMNQLWYSK